MTSLNVLVFYLWSDKTGEWQGSGGEKVAAYNKFALKKIPFIFTLVHASRSDITDKNILQLSLQRMAALIEAKKSLIISCVVFRVEILNLLASSMNYLMKLLWMN